MYKNRSPQKILIPLPSFELQDASGSVSAFTAKKRKQAFLTQMAKKMSSQQLVMQSHTQLVSYICTLENKIKNIIESHNCQFLLAYKNHLHRVKEEMKEFKNKNANNANSVSNQTQKIQILQKQLILFREQALKLFDRMTEKDKNIELLNTKVQQFQTQRKFNKRTISDLMKRNKYLEGLVKQLNLNQSRQKSFQLQQTHRKRNQFSMQANTIRKYTSQHKKVSVNLGWTGNTANSFYLSKNQINNFQFEKQSRPTTTAVKSKRNSLSGSNASNIKSVNGYFVNNVHSNLQKA